MQGYSRRAVVLTAGVSLFALTDFLYLWHNINGSYLMGSFLDIGWVVALLLIAESFWQPGIDIKAREGINPVLISISVSLSATVLALIAIRPDYFPKFIVIPAIATLALAFARMALALTQAKNIGQERLLARTDELTGLPNRRRLIAELSTFEGVEGALLLLDLNGFKPVNDRYGHEMGDRILRQVAQRFSRSLPSGAILARLGGDEFGVLVSGSDDATLELVSALKATLSYPFVLDGNTVNYYLNDILTQTQTFTNIRTRQNTGTFFIGDFDIWASLDFSSSAKSNISLTNLLILLVSFVAISKNSNLSLEFN
jgi:GGDEF domain-containing protein